MRIDRRKLILAATVAVGLSAIALLRLQSTFALRIGSLDAHPLNCRARYDHARCDPPTNGNLRVFVTVSPETGLTVLADSRVGVFGQAPSKDGHLLTVEVPLGTKTLEIRSTAFPFYRSVSIDVRQRVEPDWLRRARELLYSDHAPEARKLLEPHDHDNDNGKQGINPLDLAQATNMLAQTWYEAGEVDRSIEGFRRARDLDTSAGLFGGETAGVLYDTLCMTRLWAQQWEHYQEAIDELSHFDKELDRAPEMKIWWLMQRGDFSWRLGHPDEGLFDLEQTIAWSRRFGDQQAHAQALMASANIFYATGRRDEAVRELSQIDIKTLEPCRHANLAEKFAAIGIDALSDPEVWISNQAEHIDPRTWLAEAIKLRAPGQGCSQQKELAEDKLLLGQALILFSDEDAAEKQLLESEREFREPTLSMWIDQQDLRGEILLGRKEWNHAVTLYRNLRAVILKRSKELDGPDVCDALWRCDIGLARANIVNDKTEALFACREAEDDLNVRASLLPFIERVGFLGRHWRGTALYVSLLAGNNQLEEASNVIRRARLRALLVASRYGRLAALEPGTGDDLKRELNRYQDERVELERARQELEMAPANADLEVRRKLERLGDQALNRAVTILLLDRGGELPLTFAPPEPDEVLLTCFPVMPNWLCLAQKAGAAMAKIEVERFDVRAPPETIERQLIAQLAPLLKGATRLRVLGYGAMGRIDFGRLRLDGAPLDSRMEVVYGVDLPGLAAERPSGGKTAPRERALVVVDPRNELQTHPRIVRAAEEAVSLLGQVYEVRRHEPAATITLGPQGDGGAGGKASMPTLLLSQEIATADLLVFLGIGSEESEGAPWKRYLQMEARSGYTIGDILTLGRGPSGVIALGCGLGISSSRGSESIGIAQAFVLRGANWVVGNVAEEVDPDIAADFMVELSRELVKEQSTSTAVVSRALARTRDALRARYAASTLDGGVVANNLDGFRVFVR